VIETRGFTGKLNTDDNDYRIPNGDYVAALNITRDSQGHGQDEVVANIPGNQPIPSLEVTKTTSTFAGNIYTTFTLIGPVYRLFDITIRLYNGSTYTTYSTYTTARGDTYSSIIAGLVANKITTTGVTLNTSTNQFEVVINTSLCSFISADCQITPAINGNIKVIGNYADRVRNRQYYFTWNSNGYNTINYYDAKENIIVNLITDRKDTDNIEILNFDSSYRINHVDIIYRDEGDLLFWTDGLNPPRKLNVSTILAGGYGIIQSSYLDVAKEPPSNPPYCVYYDDTTVTLNNLNNKQFKFKYRFVFDDLEKSVTSAQSELAIPKNYSAQSTVANPTLNSNIFMVLDTGPSNVKKIEILGAESLGETWSDFFLIEVLDKNQLSIADNDIISYRFYNNQAYTTIPLDESIQPFDNVPQKAYTQSLPNGNVLDYGAITENYDLIKQESGLVSSVLEYGSIKPTGLVIASNYGNNQIKIIAGGQFTTGTQILFAFYLNGVYNTYSTSVSANSSGTVQSIYTSLKSYLQGQGFTVLPATITSTTSYLLISKSGATSLTVALPVRVFLNGDYFTNGDSRLAYNWTSRYSYGIVYFDEKGRTNGVITALTSTLQTDNYSEYTISTEVRTRIPDIFIDIYNRPPLWANYFELVRTKNLTKSNFLYWISKRTYKDVVANQAGYQYAYISIENLTEYIVENPEIKALGYEFTAGDRIRFVKLYDNTGGTSQLYTDKDYQILDSITNPVINNQTITGQVLKIVLPSTSGSFNFGTDTYAHYLIEIYSPASNFANEVNLYYEFGQRYTIFNPNTANATHQGSIANQSANLSIPASFRTNKGDSYFRYRLYPFGGSMKWQMNPGNIIANGTQGGTLLVDNSNDPNYTPVTNLAAWWYNNAANGPTVLIDISNITRSYTFNFKGSIVVSSANNMDYCEIAFSALQGFTYLSSVNKAIGPLPANTKVSTAYGVQLNCPIGTNAIIVVFKGITNGDSLNFNASIISWNIDATEGASVYQGIIDPNFSDTYDSAASPNGRAWKLDPNAKQTFNPTLIRYGGEFQAGSTINNINRFYEQNFDTYDRSRGAIKKMFIEGRNQYIFQEFDVGVVTVLTQIVKDTSGNPLSAQSDTLLNKIVYPYIGQYGIGNVPESFAFGKHAKYFVDNNKGVVCRLSSDGITPISIVYKVNNFFVDKLENFKTDLNLPAPSYGTPTVYGAFDAYTNKYIVCLSEINRDDFNQPAYTFSFLESRSSTEGFECELSFQPENIGALNNLLITFYLGRPWTHNNSIYNLFYNIDYPSYIDVVFNDRQLDRKTFLSLMETSNAVWYCPSIDSQLNSYGSTPQHTSLVAARFALLEGQYQSAILRDANSPGGIINGDTMHGNYLVVRFQKDNATDFYYINTVSLNYVNSPLNLR
jgi:hypothetical protein